jgi:hypothetical protein
MDMEWEKAHVLGLTGQSVCEVSFGVFDGFGRFCSLDRK